MSDLPALPPDLKPVPAEYEDAWRKIQEREHEQMQQALYLVATYDLSPRAAGIEAGYADGTATHLYAKAKHYGLFRPKAEKVRQTSMEIAVLAGEEVIDRLIRRPAQIEDPFLNAYYGTATDKTIKYGQPHDSRLPSLADLAAELLAQGATLELKVTPPARPDAVTVEPVQD